MPPQIAAHLLNLQVVEAATRAVREEARRCAMRGQKLGMRAQHTLYNLTSLEMALKLCNGNHTLAANVLGVSRGTMYQYVPENSILAQNDPTLIQNARRPQRAREVTKTLPGASQVAKRANGWNLSDLEPEAVEISQDLMASVLRNIPGCKWAFCSVQERDRGLLSFAIHVSQLHHLDHVPYDAIRFLAAWSQRSREWRGRIVTGKALRKHWDELQAAYEAQRESFERRRAG